MEALARKLDPAFDRIESTYSDTEWECVNNAYMEVTHHGVVKDIGSMLKAIVLSGNTRLLREYLNKTDFYASLSSSQYDPMCVCIRDVLLMSLKRLDASPVRALVKCSNISRCDMVDFLCNSVKELSSYRGVEKCISVIVSSMLGKSKMNAWSILTIAQQCNKGNTRLLRYIEFKSSDCGPNDYDLTELYRVACTLQECTELTPGAAMFAYKLASYMVNKTEYGVNKKHTDALVALLNRCKENNSLVIENGTVIPVYDLSYDEIRNHPNPLVHSARANPECKLARLKYHYEINPKYVSGIHNDFLLRALDEDMLDMALVVASERAGPDDNWFPLFLDLMACGADTTYLEGKAVRNVLVSAARPDLIRGVIDLLEEDFLTDQTIVDHLRGVSSDIDDLLTKRMVRLLP